MINANAKYNNTVEQYLEYYNGFTTYSYKSSSDAAYVFYFYLIDEGTPSIHVRADESVTENVAQWSGTADYKTAGVTADTGIDVFTHAVEAFVSTGSNDFSDACAEKAIKLVNHYLMAAYKNPNDAKARQGMHNASCLAGVAFSNAGLGLNHGMAHAMGGKFHIPHGRANGILLPYVMSFNAGCAEQLTPTAKRYAQISRLLRLDTSSVRQSALNMIRTARTFIKKMNMPCTIEAAGVTKEQFEAELDEMAAAALADRCTATNPQPVTVEDIKEIYRKAFIGKLP